jgi:hypothetical protein
MAHLCDDLGTGMAKRRQEKNEWLSIETLLGFFFVLLEDFARIFSIRCSHESESLK